VTTGHRRVPCQTVCISFVNFLSYQGFFAVNNNNSNHVLFFPVCTVPLVDMCTVRHLRSSRCRYAINFCLIDWAPSSLPSLRPPCWNQVGEEGATNFRRMAASLSHFRCVMTSRFADARSTVATSMWCDRCDVVLSVCRDRGCPAALTWPSGDTWDRKHILIWISLILTGQDSVGMNMASADAACVFSTFEFNAKWRQKKVEKQLHETKLSFQRQIFCYY